MSYTFNLIKWGVTSFVPFGDRIPGMSSKSPSLSKRRERARIAIAKQIKEAVKEGKIDPSFNEAASKMKADAKRKLSEINYKKNQYIYSEIGKSSSIVDAIVPGSGVIPTSIAQVGTTKNLKRFAKEAPSYKDTASKVGKFVIPVVIGATSSVWKPLVAPYITPSVIAGAAVAVIGTAVALDTISYFRD